MGFFELLNGKVPGGLTLLFILMVAFTFIMLYLLKNSPLLTRHNFWRTLILGYLGMIIVYAVVWRINPPIIPKTRVMIGPIASTDPNEGFALNEYLSSFFTQHENEDVYLMDWMSLFPSLPEGVNEEQYMQNMLNHLYPDLQVSGTIEHQGDGTTLQLEIIKDGRKTGSLTMDSPWLHGEQVAVFIRDKIGLQVKENIQLPGKEILLDLVKWERLFRQKNFQAIVDAIDRSGELEGEFIPLLSLYCRAMSQLAFEKKKASGGKSPLESRLTEYERMFNRARQPLIPFTRSATPDIDMLLALAKSYLLESKFSHADAVLKQCLTQEVNHYKVFYLLSFLHYSRLPEIGFKNDYEILERAWVLNPYDQKTVLRYADAMFDLRAPSSEMLYQAITLVKKYQKMNPRSIDVYMKLGYFYLYLNEIDNAEQVYNQADSLFQGDKNIILNKAIVAQRKTEFDKALHLFSTLLDEDKYKDVYTYMGSVYLEMEQPEKALEYFRKRVKILRNEEDPMYQEALKGIRKALQMQEEMSEQ